MNDTSSTIPAKCSTRLVLKIMSLSLASLCSFVLIAYMTLNNYKNYNRLLAEQNQLTQQLTTFRGLQQNLLTFAGQMAQPISFSTFTQVYKRIIEVEKMISIGQSIDSPLISQGFSQFLDFKKQMKILKLFLAKKKALLKKENVTEKKQNGFKTNLILNKKEF